MEVKYVQKKSTSILQLKKFFECFAYIVKTCQKFTNVFGWHVLKQNFTSKKCHKLPLSRMALTT
jgi:hypothetical protein